MNRKRFAALACAAMVAGLAVLMGPAAASAAPDQPKAAPLAGQCSVAQWQSPGDWDMCVAKLPDLNPSRLACLSAPTPETPTSGMAGWFASEPASSTQNGVKGLYSRYGYAGYDYTTYDVGCASPLTHPASSFEDTVANGEFMIATSVVGGANALREKSWDPANLWGWADTLVRKATASIYDKVFTVFGALTLGIVGLYLMWRSRQADMSNAMTTAGWAILVMVVITALARWPVQSAHVADSTLIGGLNVVHSAIGPQNEGTPQDQCGDPTPGACADVRSPAVRASDTATGNLLYRNWLRGLLGSADSPTAIKYGPILYDSRSLTWDQAQQIELHPDMRDATIQRKQMEWMKVAEQIKSEDPQAYSYLQGNQGMDRVGAGFIAILSSLFFGAFDITASILVLIGFLIIRWGVVAAPLLGTVGLLRPASSGLRRLGNAVIAAIFNVIIFGTGAAVYLYAVDLIMSTTSLPGWLQVVLVLLVGVVGWVLLRPYRRLTQLGGKDYSAGEVAWHRRFLRDLRGAPRVEAEEKNEERRLADARKRGELEPKTARPETRIEASSEVAPESSPPAIEPESRPETAPRRSEIRRPAGDWTEPDVPAPPSNYTIYRPAKSDVPASAPAPAPVRRPESTPVGS